MRPLSWKKSAVPPTAAEPASPSFQTLKFLAKVINSNPHACSRWLDPKPIFMPVSKSVGNATQSKPVKMFLLKRYSSFPADCPTICANSSVAENASQLISLLAIRIFPTAQDASNGLLLGRFGPTG
ncbi:unnamed protein product, partial [Ectocarpus fasciculatus]